MWKKVKFSFFHGNSNSSKSKRWKPLQTWFFWKPMTYSLEKRNEQFQYLGRSLSFNRQKGPCFHTFWSCFWCFLKGFHGYRIFKRYIFARKDLFILTVYNNAMILIYTYEHVQSVVKKLWSSMYRTVDEIWTLSKITVECWLNIAFLSFFLFS